jgi:hypothetical protein
MISCLAVLLALPVAGEQPDSRNEACPQDVPCKERTVCPRAEQEAELCQSFRGLLSFESASGTKQRRVVIQDWQIGNEETVEIPHEGFLLVHLRAGALTTDIEGEVQKRREDSFWSVPADRRLIVRTERDSAMLQTLELKRP